MKRIISLLIVIAVGFVAFVSSQPVQAYTNNRLMDDPIFDNVNSMTEQDIRNFINSRPGTCLVTSGAIFPEPHDYFSYGPNNVDAARVIYNSSQKWGINPQVIITTLQKEQSLMTDNDCNDPQGFPSLPKAMGMGCFEGQPCPTANYAGFHQQVMKGAWQLKFNKERAIGNVMWNSAEGDQYLSYSVYYTEGMRQDSINASLIYHDGYVSIDGQNIYLETGATASLYRYTPHLGQSFPSIFEGWFGSTLNGQCISDMTAVQTSVSFKKIGAGLDRPDLQIYSGSGTKCIESHTWEGGFTSWRSHVASNHQSINYPYGQVIYGDLDGSGRDYAVLFGLSGTGSGKVESHVWDNSMHKFLAHAASNMTPIDPAYNRIIMADLDGDKKDEVILVALNNTGSGNVELHQWGPGMQTWAWHTATNMPVVNPSNTNIASGDINGDGVDEIILVAYQSTGSGRVEFHIWNPGQWSWQSHIVTNLPEISTSNAKVEFADVDGNGVDEAVLIAEKNTGSGRIELHVWNPGFYSWRSNTATNQPTF